MRTFIISMITIPLLFASGWSEESFIRYQQQVIQQRAIFLSRLASQESPVSTESKNGKNESPKSIGRSVLFSALVPGSGQLYAKSYLKAGLFLATEITGWMINIRYNKLGDEKDAEFRRFADRYWSEYRYWSFVNYKAAQANVPGFTPYPYDTISPFGKIWYLIKKDIYGPDVINELRKVETRIPGFTHTLPKTKTQQYYEMIGKYPEQFGNAWEDASFEEYYSGYRNKVTPFNQKYTDMRLKSNRYYDIAGYGAMTLLVNHVIAAIDAGFTARNYNRKRVKMAFYYQNIPYKGEYVNLFGMNLAW